MTTENNPLMGTTQARAEALDEHCSKFKDVQDISHQEQVADARRINQPGFTIHNAFNAFWKVQMKATPTHTDWQGGFIWDVKSPIRLVPEGAEMVDTTNPTFTTPLGRVHYDINVKGMWDWPTAAQAEYYSVVAGHTAGGPKIGIYAHFTVLPNGEQLNPGQSWTRLTALLQPYDDTIDGATEWLSEFVRLNYDVATYEEWTADDEDAKDTQRQGVEAQEKLAEEAAAPF